MLGVDHDQKSGGPWNASEALAFGASFAGTFMLNVVTTTKWPQLHQDRPGQMLALQFVVSALIYFALAVRANSDKRPYWKVREALAYLMSCVAGFLVGFLFGLFPLLQSVHPSVAFVSAISAPVLAYFIVAYRPIGGSPGSTAPRVLLDSPASVTRHRPVVSHADCITTVSATSRNVTAAEWFLIHAGIELGPLARSELLAKASGGEIEADDLVKETGGKWIKAGEIGFLQEELTRREVRRETLEQIGRFWGIWVSSKTLVIAGCVVLALVGVLNLAKSPGENVPWIKPTKASRFPTKVDHDWPGLRDLLPLPEVSLSAKSDSSGRLNGRVHNETGELIDTLILAIRTTHWRKVYEVNVGVANHSTRTFSIFIGEQLLEIKDYEVFTRSSD